MASVSAKFINFTKNGDSDTDITIFLCHITVLKFDKSTELLTIITADGTTYQITDSNGSVRDRIKNII